MPRNKTSNRFGQSNDALAPPKLLAAARDSRLVIFAGAGISMGAPTNLPSWRDVNRVVVRSLAASAASAVGEPLAAKAADMILARHEQEKLPPEIRRKCSQSFCTTSILKFSGISTAIVQIPRIWRSRGWPDWDACAR